MKNFRDYYLTKFGANKILVGLRTMKFWLNDNCFYSIYNYRVLNIQLNVDIWNSDSTNIIEIWLHSLNHYCILTSIYWLFRYFFFLSLKWSLIVFVLYKYWYSLLLCLIFQTFYGNCKKIIYLGNNIQFCSLD